MDTFGKDELEEASPENHAVQHIFAFLVEMDGMNNCMALGILECVRQAIYQNMAEDDE